MKGVPCLTPEASHLIFLRSEPITDLSNLKIYCLRVDIKELISSVFAVVSLLSEREVDVNVMKFFVGF